MLCTGAGHPAWPGQRKSVARQRGRCRLGKQRQIDVNQLWVLQKMFKGEKHIEKVKGTEHVSDVFTKMWVFTKWKYICRAQTK